MALLELERHLLPSDTGAPDSWVFRFSLNHTLVFLVVQRADGRPWDFLVSISFINTILLPKSSKIYVFVFSGITGTFSRIDHILGHKTSLNKLNNEIMPSIFSDHNQMKLKSIAEVKLENLNVWKLNNTLVSNHWVKKKF